MTSTGLFCVFRTLLTTVGLNFHVILNWGRGVLRDRWDMLLSFSSCKLQLKICSCKYQKNNPRAAIYFGQLIHVSHDRRWLYLESMRGYFL